MFGRKIIVSVIIAVILIAIAGNMYIVSAENSEYNEILSKVNAANQEGLSDLSSWKYNLSGICEIFNYIFAIINSFILIINKKKVSKQYFIIVVMLIIISLGTAYIYQETFTYSRSPFSEYTLRDKIWDSMPVFALILQIAISISIILKLRKGKNQPECEKVKP